VLGIKNRRAERKKGTLVYEKRHPPQPLGVQPEENSIRSEETRGKRGGARRERKIVGDRGGGCHMRGKVESEILPGLQNQRAMNRRAEGSDRKKIRERT